MAFDYYYGDESEQFSFYRIPRQLITSPQFKTLSIDAKLLYGLLLDRMSLSAKNGWCDDGGRVFIYYTLDEIMEDMNCGHDKALKMLAELDKGIGLIERKKQGQGKPAKIFVKRFTTGEAVVPQGRSPDIGKSEVLSSKKPKSGLPEIRTQDFEKVDTIYTDKNQTEITQLDQSIYPPKSDWRDRCDCRSTVEESVEYEQLCEQYGRGDVDGVVELMVDTLCSTRDAIRIGGDDIPVQQVRSRFLSLERDHLEYVFDSLRRCTTQVRNIRAYLLTALYNAPATMSSHYSAQVRHDNG